MALSALYLLAAYSIPSLLSSHAGALDRLTIDDAGTELRISLHVHPLARMGRVHPLPGAADPPSSEVMMDGLPGRRVVRQ
jgi:hypothetical protein